MGLMTMTAKRAWRLISLSEHDWMAVYRCSVPSCAFGAASAKSVVDVGLFAGMEHLPRLHLLLHMVKIMHSDHHAHAELGSARRKKL